MMHRRLASTVVLAGLAGAAISCASETFATGQQDASAVDGGVAGDAASADGCATPPCTPPLRDVVVVATEQSGVDGLVVTPTAVAWATRDALRSCPLVGPCDAPFTILQTKLVGTLAVHGGEGLFMPDASGANAVLQCATGQACSGTGKIGYDLGRLHAIAVEADDFYVIDSNAARIAHCGSPTGCPNPWKTLVPGRTEAGSGLAVSATRLFWSKPGANGEVFTCLRSNCNGASIASGQANPRRLVADGKNLYWTTFDDGSVWSCPLEGCGAGPRRMARDQNAPLAIATDGERVYWTNYGSGTLMGCEAEACVTPVVLAKGLTSPSSIALSKDAIYVASPAAGTVVKIAK